MYLLLARGNLRNTVPPAKSGRSSKSDQVLGPGPDSSVSSPILEGYKTIPLGGQPCYKWPFIHKHPTAMASDTEHLPLEIDAVSPFNSVVIFPRFNVFSQLPATDFGAFVINILSHTSPKSETIDQKVLRGCIQLASSFLVTDTTTNPERGISTWSVGFCRLVDLVVVLHTRNELELETVSAASKACSECWTAAGNWPGLNECRNRVRDIGGRLKKVLDSNERTYRGMLLTFFLSSPFITCFFILGERVYAP